jgi:hypothetical protein
VITWQKHRDHREQTDQVNIEQRVLSLDEQGFVPVPFDESLLESSHDLRQEGEWYHEKAKAIMHTAH